MIKPVPCSAYDEDEALRFQHLRHRIGNAWKCFYEKAYNMIIPKLKFQYRLELEEMENIFQDKILNLSEKIENGLFDSEDKRKAVFTSMLYGYCENGIKDVLKSSKSKTDTNTSSLDFLDTESVKYGQNNGEQTLFIQDIERALDQLSEVDQELIRMRVFENREYEEISEITAIKVDNLRKYFNRAILKLRRILSQQ